MLSNTDHMNPAGSIKDCTAPGLLQKAHSAWFANPFDNTSKRDSHEANSGVQARKPTGGRIENASAPRAPAAPWAALVTRCRPVTRPRKLRLSTLQAPRWPGTSLPANG